MIDPILAALCTAIRGASQSGLLDVRLGNVAPYDGQINEAALPDLMARTPAVLAAFARAVPDEEGDRTRWDADFTLLVVTRNLAMPMAASVGGPPGTAPGTTVGAHALAQRLADLLTGETLDLPIRRIRPGPITTLVPGWMRGTKGALVGLALTTAWWTEGEASLTDRQPGRLTPFLRVATTLTDATTLTETRPETDEAP